MARESLGMKLVVELPDELVLRIREAVDDGGYEDAREFVTTAIENQLELEVGEGVDSIMTIDQAIEELSVDHDQATAIDSEPSRSTEFDFQRLDYSEVVPVRAPDSDRLESGPLWGQYNRIFPVKLVVRRLANELVDVAVDAANVGESTLVPRADFSDSVAWNARAFGLSLKEADERHLRGRGEKLSAGLPTGDKVEKSIDRFKSHFVGYQNRNGNLSGAPSVLRFVNVTDGGSSIGITEAGLKFASLSNPLLDESLEADDPLTQEERDFYVDHVERELPEEFEAMVFVANSIAEGYDRPTSLTERTAELNEAWSDAQASTIRSGIVSRMYELSFVERRQVGQRGVGYELTEKGRKFLRDAI